MTRDRVDVLRTVTRTVWQEVIECRLDGLLTSPIGRLERDQIVEPSEQLQHRVDIARLVADSCQDSGQTAEVAPLTSDRPRSKQRLNETGRALDGGC